MATVITEQRVTKRENGIDFPAAAFAFVPDRTKPSTWKLRLWSNLSDKVTIRQLGAAAAAFSPGGFRGNKVRLPSDAVAGVKRKIRSAYRRLGRTGNQIPASVREASHAMPEKLTKKQRARLKRQKRRLSESNGGSVRFTTDFIAFSETAIFDEKTQGIAEAVVIQPGFNAGATRFYPGEMLKRDHKVFEGVKMFKNHPTRQENSQRPERDINEFVGTLTNVRIGESGKVIGTPVIHDPQFRESLKNLAEAGHLHQMGLSIVASGEKRRADMEGRRTDVIESLTVGHSVDFVTQPGAGGHVQVFEADDEILTEDQLMELQELQEQLTAKIEECADLKSQVKEGTEALDKIEAEKAALQEKVSKLEAQEATREGDNAIKEALEGEGIKELPEGVKNLIATTFNEALYEGDTIKAKVAAHVLKCTEKLGDIQEKVDRVTPPRSTVKGNGPSDPPKDDKGAEDLFESRVDLYMKQGNDKDAAERKARQFVGATG